MKWFLLLVIVAILQYQGVTGFPPASLPDYAEPLPEEDLSQTLKFVKPEKIFEDFFKVDDFFEAQLNASSKDVQVRLLRCIGYLEGYLQHVKLVYCQAVEDLKVLIAEYKFVGQNDHVTKDKETQNQSTFSNVASGNKMQVDATQTDSILKKLPVFNNSPFIFNKSGDTRRIRFTPDTTLRISDYFQSKLEFIEEVFHKWLKIFKHITDQIKSHILKDKDTENQSTPENVASGDKSTPENVASGDKSTLENVASDKTQVNATQTTSTLDESVVNQQSTLDKNDDKKDKKEESKDYEESLIPESTASSNEAEEKATQKLDMLDESYEKENPVISY